MANILHVEDDESWIAIIRENLLDHRVDSARSQPEALRLLVTATRPYDLALVDLELKDRDRAGGEVLDVLMRLYPTVRRVVLTGRVPGGALWHNIFERYGVEEVLIKQDFDVPDLRRVVDAVAAATKTRGRDPDPSKLPPRSLYVSYGHRADRQYVAALAKYLAREGLSTWYDEDPASARQWDGARNARIDGCAVFLVVMTSDAEKSHWVFREISRAEEMHKPIVPLLLSGGVYRIVAQHEIEDVTGGAMPGAHFLARVRALLESDLH
jgi:CheY-like chemotaxis protein